MWSQVRARHVAAGVAVYAAGTALGLAVIQGRAPPESPAGACACKFDGLAAEYDRRIGLSEKLAGILGYRRRLLGGVGGATLEVAAGTGRNLEYYDPRQVRELVLCDVSAPMVAEARRKVSELKLGELAMVVEGDSLRLPFDDDSFDNVVDTFGLCSLRDPDRALSEMRRVCKPGGSVRLLEHGRSATGHRWVDWWLDLRAERHAERWGCWWNRDVAAIVARCEGLVVSERDTFHLGTTQLYVLRKMPGAAGTALTL